MTRSPIELFWTAKKHDPSHHKTIGCRETRSQCGCARRSHKRQSSKLGRLWKRGLASTTKWWETRFSKMLYLTQAKFTIGDLDCPSRHYKSQKRKKATQEIISQNKVLPHSDKTIYTSANVEVKFFIFLKGMYHVHILFQKSIQFTFSLNTILMESGQNTSVHCETVWISLGYM